MRKSLWFWDFMAKRFDRHSHSDDGYAKAVERFAEYLQADDIVLDYACETGVVAFKVADRVKRVHAIDTSARMIELGRDRARESNIANVTFERTSLFDDELGSGTYDVVLAFNILHLLEDAGKAIQRAVDLLKPGGVFVSSTPCLGDAGLGMRSLLPLITTFGVLPYLRKLTGAEMKAMKVDAGLEILKHDLRYELIPIWFAGALDPGRAAQQADEADGRLRRLQLVGQPLGARSSL